MERLFALLMGLFTALQLALPALPYLNNPTLRIDAAKPVAPVSSRASGYLYGLAQAGVPDPLMAESMDIASVSQKVIGGLQHPIGDVDDVAPLLEHCDYITVYLQDVYDTWYYCEGEIRAARKAGSYDSAAFVREDYLPRVREAVIKLAEKPYADRLVYCLYNEIDNGVWFGTPNADNPDWLMFDDAAKARFYAAWAETCALVRALHPGAKIGGPGNCVYDSANIRDFLAWCQAHDCLPDVMIYHELGADSAMFWQDHVDDYRKTEQALGLAPMPVIVTEFGTMEECGAPTAMLRYVTAIEESGVYANAAYWRLANNLCDTAADDNSPNSNWWLFRWYADMTGSRLQTTVCDLRHTDFANVIKYGYTRFHQKGLLGLASLDEGGSCIRVLSGGGVDGSSLHLVHLNQTNLGRRVRVKIECVYYEGLSGIVSKPVTVADYSAAVTLGSLRINLGPQDPTAVYHVTVTPDTGAPDDYNDALPQRFEFEHGTLLGGSYTYDSAYATTGDTVGMVGGIEQEGDGVALPFTVPADGNYDLKIIYGKHNDGGTPDGRIDGTALLTLDGATQTLTLPNTIRSEYTETRVLTVPLAAGQHTLTLQHKDGTFVVDSLLVCPHDADPAIALLADADRSSDGVTAYLAVAPADGTYTLTANAPTAFRVDGAVGQTDDSGTATVALRRGLNMIELARPDAVCSVVCSAEDPVITALPDAMTLTAPAALTETKRGVCLTGITGEGGSAAFTVTVPAAGDYRLTFAYANNEEGGVHSYNVDLIERYLTVTVNGECRRLWCRSTYSWETVKTATVNLPLQAGENTVVITNDGGNRFHDRVPQIPAIYSVTLRQAVQ